MKYIPLLIFIPLFMTHIAAAAEINIIFPPQGSTLNAVNATFVIGHITPLESPLEINGLKISPYRTGSFLAMVPTTPGTNILHIKAGKTEQQHIFYLSPPPPTVAAPRIKPLFPTGPTGVLTGETVKIRCQAPAGLTIQAQVGERLLALKPEPDHPDHYSDTLRFGGALTNMPVTFFSADLPDAHGGPLTALIKPQAYKVTGKLFEVRARSRPGDGETVAILPPGFQLFSTGYSGEYITADLGETKCFIHRKALQPIATPGDSAACTPLPDISRGFGPFPSRGKKPPQTLIVLDAGHGGSASGAVGPSGLTEKEVTLKQVLKIDAVLKAAGYQTQLTRSSDIDIGLYDRVRLAYNKRADAFISIHYNSCPYNQNPRERRHIATYAWNSIGAALAGPVQAELKKISPAPSKGVLHGNLAVCRNPAVPSILIELDFITTPEGEELIQSAGFQEDVANAVSAGIRSWCGKQKGEE